MANKFTLSFRVVDRASNSFRRIARSTEELQKRSKGAGKSWGDTAQILLATSGAITAAFTSAAASAAEVEDALARLETVTKGSAGQITSALGEAKQAAIEFSTQYTASAAQIIDAQFQIATAGVALEEQVAATQGAFKLAIATQGTFAQSTQLLGSLLNTFGKAAEFSYLEPAKKVEAITDKLSLAVQRFQVTLPVLSESLKFVIGPASTLGLKFGEVTAALGVLNTAGFRGSLAGTALSNMFNKLDRAVNKLNLDPSKFTDLNGNLKDMASFLEEVERGIQGMTSIEQQNKLIEVFDIRAGRVVKTLLNQISAIRKNTVEMDLNRGATEKMAQVQQNTLSAATQKAVNSFTNLSVAVGEALVPTLKVLMGILNGTAELFRTVVVAMGPFATVIINITAALAALTVGTVIVAVAIKALKAAGFGAMFVTAMGPVKNLTRALVFSLAPAAYRAGMATTALVVSGMKVTIAWKAVLSVFAVVGAKLVAIGAIIYGVAKAVIWLAEQGDEMRQAAGSAFKPWEEGFEGLSAAASRTAAELEMISKLGQAQARMTTKDDVGTGFSAKALEEIVAGDVTQSDQAVVKLTEHFAGLREEGEKLSATIIRLNMGDIFEGGPEAAGNFANSLAKLREDLDLSWESMSVMERAAFMSMQAVKALDKQILKLAGGSDELAHPLKKVNDALIAGEKATRALANAQAQLNATQDHPVFEGPTAFAVRKNTQSDAIKEVAEAGAELKKQQKALAEVFKTTGLQDMIKRSVHGTDELSKALRTIFDKDKVKKAMEDEMEGAEFGEVLLKAFGGNALKIEESFAKAFGFVKTFDDAQKQVSNTMSNANASFEKADDGVIGYSEALKRVRKSMADLGRAQRGMENQDLNKIAQAFKLRGDDRPLAKIVQDLQDDIDGIKVQRLGLKLRSEALNFQAEIQKRINNVSVGELSNRLRVITDDLAKSLHGATVDFLTKGDASTFADNLRDAIKSKVVDGAATQLITSLTQGLSKDIESVRSKIASGLNVMTNLGDFSKFAEMVNQAFRENPRLAAILGDKIEPAAKQFAKDLSDAIKDSRISLEVMMAGDPDSLTKAFGDSLRRVMDTTVSGAVNNIGRLKTLFKDATRAGIDNAMISEIQTVLKASLKANAGLTDSNKESLPFEQFKDLVPVMDAGQKFATMFTGAVQNLGTTLATYGGRFIKSLTPEDGGGAIDIKVGEQTANVNIDVSGSGGGLDEADVASIVDAVKESLMEFVTSSVREVQEQLDELKNR